MKYLKTFQILITIIVISIAAGCSDQIISGSGSSNSNSSDIAAPKVPSSIEYSSRIELSPNCSYSYNYVNTQFVKINSINVQSIQSSSVKREASCKDFEVWGYSADSEALLNCISKDFEYTNITIRNVSSVTLQIYVILTGEKERVTKYRNEE